MRTTTCRILLSVLISATGFGGCSDALQEGAGDGADGAAAVRGGTAVIAGIADLQGMNTLVTDEQYTRQFQREILLMPLVRYDERLEVVPWLAERWDTARVAADTLELTFHLRKDVRWHDGRPTTAEDVKFTFERAADRDHPSLHAAALSQFSPRAEVVDPYTVRVRFRQHAEFMDGWTQLGILPHHLLGEVPPEGMAAHAFNGEAPVGNGPFRFVRRAPGQEWVFEANPDFPAALGGRPYLDRLVYRVIPDRTTMLTELLTGGIDVYLNPSAEQTEQLEGASGIELRSTPAPQWVFIAWNGQRPWFDTPDERRALTLGIDRDRMVTALVGDHGVLGHSPLTPVHWAWDQRSPGDRISYDPERARALLASSGWRDRDGDGTLEDPQGHPYRFELLVTQGNQSQQSVAEVVQAQLKAIGVDVRPRVLEGNTLISRIVGEEDGSGARKRNYDAVVIGWVDNLRKDDSNLFHSRNLSGPFQITSYSNPQVDRLLDSLAREMDRNTARRLWKEYEGVMARDAPTTVLYYPNRVTGLRSRLNGVTIDARGELASVTRWWLQEDQGGNPP